MVDEPKISTGSAADNTVNPENQDGEVGRDQPMGVRTWLHRRARGLAGGLLRSVREEFANERLNRDSSFFDYSDNTAILAEYPTLQILRHEIEPLAPMYRTIKLVEAIANSFFVIGLAVSSVSAVLGWLGYLGLGLHDKGLGAVGLYLLLLVLDLLILIIPILRGESGKGARSSRPTRTYMRTVFLVNLVLLIVALTSITAGSKSVLQFISIAVPTVFVAIVLLRLIAVAGFNWVAGSVYRNWYRREPTAWMLILLSKMNFYVRDFIWENLDRRNELLIVLESMAQCLQHGLTGTLNTGDIQTRAWLRQEARRRTAFVRELKKEVCLSREGSRERVAKACSDMFGPILSNNWAQLPAKEVPRDEVQDFRIRTKRFFQALPLALLPAAVLASIELLGELEGDLRTYLWSGAALWAAVSLLPAIDPQLRDKIGMLKELVSLTDPLTEAKPERQSSK